MRYRKVVPISIRTNSEKNLVCRQQFALKYLRALLDGKVILNVDESWLNMTDFRRRKWQAHRSTNSVAQLTMSPRISMIVGLDTNGKVYLSLLQSNNNQKTMEIFFQSLVTQLDKEYGDWRTTHIILLDNAPYHVGASTIKMLDRLSIPVCFTAPYSYDTAPIELWFASFK